MGKSDLTYGQRGDCIFRSVWQVCVGFTGNRCRRGRCCGDEHGVVIDTWSASRAFRLALLLAVGNGSPHQTAKRATSGLAPGAGLMASRLQKGISAGSGSHTRAIIKDTRLLIRLFSGNKGHPLIDQALFRLDSPHDPPTL
jgi:hypothetical protein